MNLLPVVAVAVLGWWLFYDDASYTPLNPSVKSFTMYYASWCPHCKRVKPTWKRLGSSYNGIAVRAVEQKQLNNEFQVEGFPTFVFRDGTGGTEVYRGDRSLEAFQQYLNTKA